VGLGVDLSHLYLAKTELQNTADAAALAGASALTLPMESRISTATDRAIQVMNLNKYNFDNKNFADVKTLEQQRALVKFAINLDGPYISEEEAIADPTNIRFIQVQTPTVPVSIFFAMPILGTQQNLNAHAIAGLSVPGNVNFCPGPLAVIDCGTLGAACVDSSGNPVHLAGVCNAGGPLPNPDGTACDPDKQLCRNCRYTIRAEPAGGPAPGNYHGLCCPNQTCDADWIRQRLAGGNDCIECPPVNPGDEIEPTTKPGINAGPVRQGINTRFDEYTSSDLNPIDNPPDPNIATNGVNGITWHDYTTSTYFQAPSHDPAAGRRLLILPITPYSSWTDGNGRTTVTVGSLGAFFLQKKVGNGNDGEIYAEYVGDDIISAVGLAPGGSAITNVVTPVLYR
jgi:Flp pilus assembly protein TadG